MKYIAKKDEWFDEGTEATLIDDYRLSTSAPFDSGLFLGIHNGKPDEEVCSFDEFDIAE